MWRPTTKEDLYKAENNNIDEFLDAQFASLYQILNISTEILGEYPCELKIELIDIDEEKDNNLVLDFKENE